MKINLFTNYSKNSQSYNNTNQFNTISNKISFSAYRGVDGYGTQADRDALKPQEIDIDKFIHDIEKVDSHEGFLYLVRSKMIESSEKLKNAVISFMAIHKDYDNSARTRIKEIVELNKTEQKTPYKGSFQDIIKNSKNKREGRLHAEFLDVAEDFVEIFNKYLVDGLMQSYYVHKDFCRSDWAKSFNIPESDLQIAIKQELEKNAEIYDTVFGKLDKKLYAYINGELSQLPENFKILTIDNKLLLKKAIR